MATMRLISSVTSNPDKMWRVSVAAELRTPLSGLPREVLRGIEIFPGVRLGADEIVVPEEWLPAGSVRNVGTRTLRPLDALVGLDADQPGFDDKVFALQVIMGAALLIPRTSRRRRGYLPKPATWIQFCHRLFQFTRWVVKNRPHADVMFSHLTIDDCAEAVRNTCREIGWALSEITKLRLTKHVADWPNFPLELDDVYALVDMPEKIRRGALNGVSGREASAAVRPTDRSERRKYQPLPDVFVTEAGWRVLRFVEDLGPNLIRLSEALGTPPASVGDSWERLNGWRQSVLLRHQWLDSGGGSIGDLPFPIRLRRGSNLSNVIRSTSQITQFLQVKILLELLQIAHFHVVSLCMAGRVGEVLSLQLGCVTKVAPPRDDIELQARSRAEGITYKLSFNRNVTARDWPLHPIAAAAIGQQEALAWLMGAEESGPLWVLTRATDEGRMRGDEARIVKLRRLVRSFFLEEFIDADGLHHHRYRKTVARLIALAIVGAPKVLMDLFGHKSIWMTLDYILSDPDIAAEIERTVSEMVQLNAESAIAAGGGHGGIAGRRLNDFLAERATRGERELGVATITEAARTISLNGKSWLMMRKGIVCTKGPYQVGPCTRDTGLPDTSRCKVDCPNRFEHAAARADAEKAIEYLVAKLEVSADWSKHDARYFIGQLRYQLRRFDDLRSRWNEHVVVRRLADWEKTAFGAAA